MSTEGGSGGKIIIVSFFLLAIIGVVIFLVTAKSGKDAEDTSTSQSNTEEVQSEKVEIAFLYSTEKEAWIKELKEQFEKANPNIKVTLKGRGSLNAVRDILDAKEKPTMWSPADHVALNLLSSDWSQKHRKKIFADSGKDEPQPLVLTPLVFVTWEDRGKVLAGTENSISWQKLFQLLGSTEGWPLIGGSAEWGFIKLGHTNPTKSNSGLQALILMAYEFHNKTNNIIVSDILNQDFQNFVKVIEKGVPKFGDSTGKFMKDMILYGPSKYDIVVTYENLAIEQIPNAQGRWGNLLVFYPKQTMWSSHPVALLNAPWVTENQKKAARKFITFLKNPASQKKALQYGFRPADPSIPILTEDIDNPFTNAKAYGIRINIPPVVELPPGPVVSNLMEMWSRTIGR